MPTPRSLLLALLLPAAACARAEAVVSPTKPLTAPGEGVPSSPPLPVRTAPIELASPPPIHGTGMLAGKEEVKLSFKNGGTVAALRVEAGAQVKRGQLLASLDRTEIQNQVAEAQAAADKAQRDHDRALQLQQSGTVAQAALDNAQTALDVAKAQLAIARYNDRVAALTAPEDGVIEQRLTEVGELVGPGQSIYTLRTRDKGLVLRVGLTDRQLQDVALGSQAEIRFGAAPGRVYRGTLSELASSASPHTGTFEAEFKLAETEAGVPAATPAPKPPVNPSDDGLARLRPGLVGVVEIARPQVRLPWVPVEALVEQSGMRATVYALDPSGKAERHPVEIAYLQGTRAAIATGLEGVAAVVVDGAAALEPGRPTEAVR